MKVILFLCYQVLFISFFSAEISANYKGDKVEIHWLQSNNSMAHSFIIERSKNGKYFKEIIKIKCSNNNNTEYYETDYHPPHKIAYYRIKQVDIDGNYKYSKTILVKNYNKLKYYGNNKKALKGYKGRNILLVLKNKAGKDFYLKADVTEYKKELFAMGNIDLEPGSYLIISAEDDLLLNKKVTIIGREKTLDSFYTQNIK